MAFIRSGRGSSKSTQDLDTVMKFFDELPRDRHDLLAKSFTIPQDNTENTTKLLRKVEHHDSTSDASKSH